MLRERVFLSKSESVVAGPGEDLLGQKYTQGNSLLSLEQGLQKTRRDLSLQGDISRPIQFGHFYLREFGIFHGNSVSTEIVLKNNFIRGRLGYSVG